MIDLITARDPAKKYLLFNGISPMNFVIFEPIYNELVKDERFVINFVNALDDTNVYKNLGIPEALFFKKKSVMLKKWDLYIATVYIKPFLLRKTKRIFIPHGNSDKKSVGVTYMVRKELLRYDNVFFASKGPYSEFTRKFGNDAKKISILSGFQRIDYLAKDHFNKNAVKEKLKIDESLPIILFAPTWGEHGALNKFGLEIIDKLLSFKANVLVKLHDESLSDDPWRKNRFNWKEKIKSYSRFSNFFGIKDFDPYPYMCIADVLVSDYGSLIFEFQAMKKPTIFFNIAEHNEEVVNDLERLELLKKACITIDTPSALDGAIEKTKESSYRDNIYKEKIREKYFINFGRSTDIIVNEIYGLLGMKKQYP